MHLKRLELIGFKSFVDKTDFEFGAGVTGIVGPNGCGKSNVVDAFKWILGEQSAKGLRGSEMKDVIFNGTQSRKPSGFAEVSVIFDNSDRFFDIDFNEVALTRRLFRSGESEYLINKQRMRLKDIRGLLMGTGIGATSYSIFEQGKIDVLLQASAVDRRIIFEEAAGISKYRSRKHETLRALERVEENLARAGDVIAELEKRAQRVRAQASKARRYREHADRLRSLRIRLAVEEFGASVQDRAELTFRRFALEFRIQRLDDLAARLREGLERFSVERRVKSQALREVRERLSAIRMGRERTESSIEHNRRRLQDLSDQGERRRTEHRDVLGALEGVRAELAHDEQEHAAVLAELDDRRRSMDAAMGALDRLREEHGELRRRGDETKKAVVQRMDEQARWSNDEVQIQSEVSNLLGRRDRLESQIAGVRVEQADLESRAQDLEAQLEGFRGEASRLEAALVSSEEDLQALQRDRDETARAIGALQAETQGARSRHDVLATFEENLDGVAQGVAALLREADKGETSFTGVHGLLAHRLRVDSEFALAVEAALSHRSQAIVVDSQEAAVLLLDRARQLKAGAVECIALDRIEPAMAGESPDGETPDQDHEAVLGSLRQRVDVEGACEDLLDRLLDGVVLVRDLPTALALSRNGLRQHRLVTLAGELVEPVGSLSIAGDATTGLISRRSEMRAIEARIAELIEEIGRLEAVDAGIAAALRDKDEQVRETARQRESASLAIAAFESEHGQVERERERHSRLLFVADSELADVTRDLDRLSMERSAIASRLVDIELQRRALESEAAELDGRIHDHGEALQRAAENVTENRVLVAQSEKREEGLRRAVDQLARSIAERESRGAALAEEVALLGERHEATRDELTAAIGSLDGIRAEEDACQIASLEAEVEDDRLARVEDGFRAEIDRLRAEAAGLSAERERLNLKDQESVLRRQSMLERVAADYELDLVALLDRVQNDADRRRTAAAADVLETEAVAATASDSNDIPDAAVARSALAVVGSVVARAPTLEEEVRGWLDGSDADWDREQAAAAARELQETIRRLGNVNLDALEELDELEERLQFQIAQRDDLQSAQRDLRNIINEINKTSRELFTKTFNDVQRNFGHLFEKCFGGGKAELVLEDGADVLDAGIEIIARPPGKKLTSLSLMSGGEKTMTTIALMFAIFKAKPSPFCVLDEVDAPLDEANVRRFVVLLDEFVDLSQFIIVTHNKITMAVTDRLYGVTMQERGVSKRVSVQIDKYDPDDPHASISTGDIEEAPIVEARIARSGAVEG